MKKLTIAFISVIFLALSAQADSIGVRISQANMDASGSHTTNSTTAGKLSSGGAAVNASGNSDFMVASLFAEKDFDMGAMSMSLGLDVIPFTTEIDKLGGGDGFDATIEVGNLITAYIQPTFDLGDMSVFAKVGYSQADLDITNISRQATAAGTASTDGNTGKDLEGMMYGAGIQKAVQHMGGDGFVRLEATFTDFDEITHTNSNGKIVKADAEMTMISLSLGKTF
ncbi:hypothetical protein OAT75_01145 [Candidatus Pelagibacter sp.]|nr:hypothetical protein [Candidatus Pelagibacter sp.]